LPRGVWRSRPGKAATSPYWQQKLAEVSQYDPEFDAVNYNARAATRRDFTSGKGANNIRALNTAIGHLGHLADQISGTASHGGFPGATTFNRAQNALARSSGSSGVTQFEQTAGALAGELTQVYRASGGAEADIQRYLAEMDPNGSAEQKKAAVANIMSLLQSRLDALGDQYNKGMGIAAGGLQPLDDRSKAALTKYLPGFNAGQYGGPTQGHPGTGGTSPVGPAGSGDQSYATPEDQQVAAEMERVYRGGGSLQDMIGVSQKFGRPANLADVAGWQKALDYRDGKGAYQGHRGYSPIQTPQSGRRLQGNDVQNLIEQGSGDLAASGPGAALMGAANNLPGMDEITGGLDALRTGNSLSSSIANADFQKQAIARNHPGWYLGGSLAGGLAEGFGLGKLAPGVAEFLTKTPLRTVGTGAAYGGVSGALEANNDRTGGAILGGMLGAGGAGLGMLGGLGTEAAITSRPGRALFKPDAPEFQPGERALSLDTITAGRQNMEDAAGLNLPYALADADPKLRMLAGSVARKSPNARQLAENTFDPRAMGQADRAVQAIDTHLAPITNVEQRGSELLDAGDQAAGPYYNQAFDRPGPVDPQIAAMLDTPGGRAGIAQAHTIAGNRRLDPNAMGFDLNDQGEVVLKSVPSYKTLQLVKRGLDAHLNSYADQFGNVNLRGNPVAQSVADLKGDFNNRLGQINKNYAKGNEVWSGFAQRRDALNLGHDILPKNSVPFRQFEAGRAGLTPETLPEAQMGYATSMADTANRARVAANPYDSIYGSPLQQQKVGAMFPEGSGKFGRIYELERDMGKTRTETLGGSPTQARNVADQLFDSPMGSALDMGVQLHTGGGVSPKAIAGIGRMIHDNWKLGVGKKKADALAPILFNTNPQQTLDYLTELALRQTQDKARKTAAKRRGGLFGSSIAPSAGFAVAPFGQ
jgi:hypothetical protein